VAAVLRGLRQALSSSDEAAARALISRWVEGYQGGQADLKTS